MKRIIARLLVMSMFIGMMTIPVYGATATEEKIDAFVEGVFNLDQRDEFVNMLVLLRNVDDETGFLEAYTSMFNGLLSGQQDRLSSFGATIQAASGFGKYFMNEEFSISNLESYLGLNDGTNGTPESEAAFKAALMRRQSEFEDAVGTIDAAAITAGFERMDKLFGMLDQVQKLIDNEVVSEYAIEFLKLDSNGDMSVYEDRAALIVLAANLMLDDKIEEGSTVVSGLQVLADFYNEANTQDQKRIKNYLQDYGFLAKDVVVVKVPGPTRTVTVLVTEPIEEIVDFGTDPIPLASGLFRDLGNYVWAATAIRQLYIAEVIMGKDEDTFDPSGLITRAEFAAMLTRMFETKLLGDGPATTGVTYTSNFTDVSAPSWYVDEVEAAFLAGYVKGIGQGLFGPNQKITREQIATMLARVLIDKGVAAPSLKELDEILATFSDSENVSDWAKLGSAMCVSNGIITGKESGDNMICGFDQFASRAEVAVMLYRIVEQKLIESEVVVFGDETDAPIE